MIPVKLIWRTQIVKDLSISGMSFLISGKRSAFQISILQTSYFRSAIHYAWVPILWTPCSKMNMIFLQNIQNDMMIIIYKRNAIKYIFCWTPCIYVYNTLYIKYFLEHPGTKWSKMSFSWLFYITLKNYYLLIYITLKKDEI